MLRGKTNLLMRLKVNGQEQNYTNVRTPVDLLEKLGVVREHVAVMINDNVVRRANLESAELKDGDTVEIITMVGGG